MNLQNLLARLDTLQPSVPFALDPGWFENGSAVIEQVSDEDLVLLAEHLFQELPEPVIKGFLDHTDADRMAMESMSPREWVAHVVGWLKEVSETTWH